jgi:hypothetical protein
MTARWRTFVSLALLLGVFGVACGKYGPPVRVPSRTEAAQPARPADPSEEDSDRKEKKP